LIWRNLYSFIKKRFFFLSEKWIWLINCFVSVCVRESEIEGQTEWVCVCVRERGRKRECLCERERKKEWVCVREREEERERVILKHFFKVISSYSHEQIEYIIPSSVIETIWGQLDFFPYLWTQMLWKTILPTQVQ
jgi:hypothetical protein